MSLKNGFGPILEWCDIIPSFQFLVFNSNFWNKWNSALFVFLVHTISTTRTTLLLCFLTKRWQYLESRSLKGRWRVENICRLSCLYHLPSQSMSSEWTTCSGTVQTWATVVSAVPHSTNACAETEGTDRHSKSAGFNGMEIKSNNNIQVHNTVHKHIQ